MLPFEDNTSGQSSSWPEVCPQTIRVYSDSLKVDFYLKKQVLLGPSFSFTNESEDSYKYIGAMINLMCKLDWARRCPNIWLKVIHGYVCEDAPGKH